MPKISKHLELGELILKYLWCACVGRWQRSNGHWCSPAEGNHLMWLWSGLLFGASLTMGCAVLPQARWGLQKSVLNLIFKQAERSREARAFKMATGTLSSSSDFLTFFCPNWGGLKVYQTVQIYVYKSLKEQCTENIARLLSVRPNARTRGCGHKLECRSSLWTPGVLLHCADDGVLQRLHRGCGVCSLRVSSSHLAVALGILLWVAWQVQNGNKNGNTKSEEAVVTEVVLPADEGSCLIPQQDKEKRCPACQSLI